MAAGFGGEGAEAEAVAGTGGEAAALTGGGGEAGGAAGLDSGAAGLCSGGVGCGSGWTEDILQHVPANSIPIQTGFHILEFDANPTFGPLSTRYWWP